MEITTYWRVRIVVPQSNESKNIDLVLERHNGGEEVAFSIDKNTTLEDTLKILDAKRG